jgi:hypothetical protein
MLRAATYGQRSGTEPDTLFQVLLPKSGEQENFFGSPSLDFLLTSLGTMMTSYKVIISEVIEKNQMADYSKPTLTAYVPS